MRGIPVLGARGGLVVAWVGLVMACSSETTIRDQQDRERAVAGAAGAPSQGGGLAVGGLASGGGGVPAETGGVSGQFISGGAYGTSGGSNAGASPAEGGTGEGGTGEGGLGARQLTCHESCYNQSCAARTDMCTVEYGRCAPVPCVADKDCCALAACDDVLSACETSPYFMCEGGFCQRASADYSGECRLATAEPDCDNPCPAAMPRSGDRCNVASHTCSYGDRDCYCGLVEGRIQWVCHAQYACETTCFNQTCPDSADMCTVEQGYCQPVPCEGDGDCCALSLCDNLTERCRSERSKFFACRDGSCVRAEPSYVGLCRDMERLFPDEASCEDLCPSTQPVSGTRCQVPERECVYANATCRCNTSGAQGIGWFCQ